MAKTKVQKLNWIDNALEISEKLLRKKKDDFTMEELRFELLKKGLRKPNHPNHWGGFSQSLINRGFIYSTGGFDFMKSKKSHGRSTPVYYSGLAG